MTSIILASDHRGFWLKEYIKQHVDISESPINWYDAGAYTQERSDYAEYAMYACNLMFSDIADYAVMICGTGTGMAIAANRYTYLYAGVAWTPEIARHGKEDDNLNVLALPADWISRKQAEDIIYAWHTAHFKGGRYAKRLRILNGV